VIVCPPEFLSGDLVVVHGFPPCLGIKSRIVHNLEKGRFQLSKLMEQTLRSTIPCRKVSYHPNYFVIECGTLEVVVKLEDILTFTVSPNNREQKDQIVESMETGEILARFEL